MLTSNSKLIKVFSCPYGFGVFTDNLDILSWGRSGISHHFVPLTTQLNKKRSSQLSIFFRR